jgi:anthranilate synthase component 2
MNRIERSEVSIFNPQPGLIFHGMQYLGMNNSEWMSDILLIDNYDSFTWNLVHYLEQWVNAPVTVWRNDEVDFDKLKDFRKIVLSPGPGIPEEAGDLIPVIHSVSEEQSLLGVCLGMQAIALAFGGKLINTGFVYHGIPLETIPIVSDERLFDQLPDRFVAGRYHSWVVEKSSMPVDLEITSVDKEGLIMSLRHKTKKIRGVQFHPESVMTPSGLQMIGNFIHFC